MHAVLATTTQSRPPMTRDALYREVTEKHGRALARLATGYEAEPERRRDLLQDIHAAVWRSLTLFDKRCSLRTWVYRVAHNVATTHLVRQSGLHFEELKEVPAETDLEGTVDNRLIMERVFELIHELPPVERQVIILYLEGLDAMGISEITGLSTSNVATRVHRIKSALAVRFHERRRP
jgi:RNA polymerase sigma-70 factor, ECF subfamily